MFERFTERARRVIILAQEEAKRLNHSTVGTEHILLGIIREGEGVASKVLASLNINPERVRAEIESAIGRGERIPYEEVAFTSRAKKVLELALDEARRLGHNYIGTEHLLLGLIREGEGVAARVLEAVGADLERVRSQVPHHLDIRQCGKTPTPGPTVPPRPMDMATWAGPTGTAMPGEQSDQITTRLHEITKRLEDMQTHVQKLRTELHTGLRSQLWQFAALALTVGLIAAALLFRH